MCNSIEYSSNYLKGSWTLWQYFGDEPAVNSNGVIVDFDEAESTKSFNFKAKVTGETRVNGRKGAEIMVPLKYLSNFRGTLEMPSINCEINLILTWSEIYVIVSTANADQAAIFSICDTNSYVPVVTLSSDDNTKPLQQLKSGFKKPINWNKYQSSLSIRRPSQNSDYLTDPSFQRVNRVFVLSFENNGQQTC